MPRPIRLLAALIVLACIGGCGCMLSQEREKLREQAELRPLLKALRDSDPAVREKAVYALGNMGDKGHDAILPALLDVIEDDDNIDVRIAAITTLVSMAPGKHAWEADAAEILTDIIESDEPMRLRLAAICAIPEITFQAEVDRTDMLVGLLDDPSPEIKAEALDVLADYPVQYYELNPVLIDYLKDDDARVRAKAAAAFRNPLWYITSTSHPPKYVISALTDALDDEAPEVRYQAAVSLGVIKSGEARAVPILIDALGDLKHRYMAMRALAGYGHDAASAAPMLIELLKPMPSEPTLLGLQNLEVSADVMKYLEENYPTSLFLACLKEAGVESVEVAVAGNGRKTLKLHWPNGRIAELWQLTPDFFDVFGIFSDFTRSRAATTLGAIGPAPGVVDALIAGINDDDRMIRHAAIVALENLTEYAKKAIPLIIERLKDEDDSVRTVAAITLGKFGPGAADAVPALIAALGDADHQVREHAVESLGEIGPAAKDAVPALNRILDGLDPNFLERDDSIVHDIGTALVRISPESGDLNSYIEELLKRDDPVFRAGVIEGIGEFAPESIQYITMFFDDDNPYIRGAVSNALYKSCRKSPEVVHQLIPFLEGKDLAARDHVATVIRGAGPAAKEAVPALLKILETFNPQTGLLKNPETEGETVDNSVTAINYVYILQSLGPYAADAVPLLTTFLTSEDLKLRAATITALGRIGQSAAGTIPAIMNSLSDEDEDVVYSALAAVKAFGPLAEDAIPALEALLASDNAELRRYSIEALGAMGAAAIPALQKAASQDGDSHIRRLAKDAILRIQGG